MAEIVISEKVVKEERIEIKPCPFCGSVEIKLINGNGEYGYSPAYAYCKCLYCGATSGNHEDSNGMSKELKLSAIRSWNRRVGDNDA